MIIERIKMTTFCLSLGIGVFRQVQGRTNVKQKRKNDHNQSDLSDPVANIALGGGCSE